MGSRSSHHYIVIVLSICSLLSGAASASTLINVAAVGGQAAAKQKGGLKVTSERQAVRLAKRHYPGKVLKVSAGSNGYRVKLLSDSGKVFSVHVDARSGRVSKG